jgi:predicted nuclease of restriction endonuclease-like RecB superfamily
MDTAIVKSLLKTANTCRNKFERDTLTFLRKKRAKFEYESEKIPYIIASHYIPDFIILTSLGKIYVECKGYFRPEDKRKLANVKKQNPSIDLRLLFYSHNKKNIQWAEKNGFRYAVETIPDEWLEGL